MSIQQKVIGLLTGFFNFTRTATSAKWTAPDNSAYISFPSTGNIDLSVNAGQFRFQMQQNNVSLLTGDLALANGTNINLNNSLGVKIQSSLSVPMLTGLNGASPVYLQNTGGNCALAIPFTSVTNALANTNLSRKAYNGETYNVRAALAMSNSTASEGGQFDFGGGTATGTFVGSVSNPDGNATLGVKTTAALNTALTVTALTGTAILIFEGIFICSGSGTVILRGAENSAHITGTLTIAAGSAMRLEDLPTV